MVGVLLLYFFRGCLIVLIFVVLLLSVFLFICLMMVFDCYVRLPLFGVWRFINVCECDFRFVWVWGVDCC